MGLNFSYYQELFTDYSASFLQGNKREQEVVATKIEHTYRVVENARFIATREKISGEEREIILIASLFHDIGRFSQFAEYGTFLDQQSVNHARRGVAVIKDKNFLGELPRDIKKMILTAVELHNRKDLPGTVQGQLADICNIVRDSDKLDIFRVLLNHLENQDPNDPAIVLNVASHPDNYSGKIYESVLAGRSCAYEDMVWTNDFRLMLASWIPLLNYPSSYQVLERSGNYDRLFNQLPQTNEFEILKEKLDEYIVRSGKI